MSTPPPQITEPKMATPSKCEAKQQNNDDLMRAKADQIIDDLDDAVISRLEIHTNLTANRPLAAPSEIPEDPCPICFDKIKNPISSLCGRHCILQWLKSHPTCPICRYDSLDLIEQVGTIAYEDLMNAITSLCEASCELGYFRHPETGSFEHYTALYEIGGFLNGWIRWHVKNIERGFEGIADSDESRHWYVELMREQVRFHRGKGKESVVSSREPELWEALAELSVLPLPEEDGW